MCHVDKLFSRIRRIALEINRKQPAKPDRSELIHAVKALRAELGMTQQDLAVALRTAVRTVARWEAVGPQDLALYKLRKFANERGANDLAQIFDSALIDAGLDEDAIEYEESRGRRTVALVRDPENPSYRYLVTRDKSEIDQLGDVLSELQAGKSPEDVSAELGEPLEAVRKWDTTVKSGRPAEEVRQERVGRWIEALRYVLEIDTPRPNSPASTLRSADLHADCIRLLKDLRDVYYQACLEALRVQELALEGIAAEDARKVVGIKVLLLGADIRRRMAEPEENFATVQPDDSESE